MVKDLNDPTNRDSVPAMLTPGEFVLNKEATQMFGPIIQQMNDAGLQQRVAENGVVQANVGMPIYKTASYNEGGLVGFLKEKEGYRDKAYQDEAGVWTIGYGRTTNPDGSPIRPNQATNKEAEETWLQGRASSDREAVEAFGKKHGYEWSPKQIDALTSFRYNIGNLEQLTQGGTRTNEEIATMLPKYNKVTVGGKKVPSEGLTNRRNDELALFTGNGKGTAVATVPPQEAPPTPVEEVGGFGGFLGDTLADVGRSYLGSQTPVLPVPQVQTRAPQQPQYIESVARKKPVQSFNTGSWVSDLFSQKKKKKAQDPFAGYAGYNQQDFLKEAETINNPGAQTQGYQIPQQPQVPSQVTQPTPVPPAGSLLDTNPRGQPRPVGVPRLPGQAPQLDTAPPVPGSDEAILQGASQQVEMRESDSNPRMGYESGQDYAQSVPPSLRGQAAGGGRLGPSVNPSAPPQPQAPPPQEDPSGYAGYTQDDFLREAQPQGVQGGSADPTAPRLDTLPPKPGDDIKPALEGEDPTKGMTTREKHIAGKKIVAEQVQQNGEEPSPELVAEGHDAVAAKGEAAVKENPARGRTIAKQISKTFGGLINKEELARMALLFVGARLTGASAGQALSFAGQNYINRIDAMASNKQSHYQELVKGGKYTPGSIKAYQESGDPTMLMPTSAAPTELGNSKEFYNKDGKRVQAREVQVGDNKYWIDGNGKQVNLNTHHEDPSRAQGTPEYRKRITDEGKTLSSTFEDMQERFGKYTTKEGKDAYTTELIPGKVGLNAAKWALENDVPPEAMGQLLENAYRAALDETKKSGGEKKARSITAYLNEQFNEGSTGDASLFQTEKGDAVSPAKVKNLFNSFSNVLKNAEGFKGLTPSQASQRIVQMSRPKWAGFDKKTREDYNRRGRKSGVSGFMIYLQDELDSHVK